MELGLAWHFLLAQAGFEFTVFHLNLPNAGITGVYHVWLAISVGHTIKDLTSLC